MYFGVYFDFSFAKVVFDYKEVDCMRDALDFLQRGQDPMLDWIPSFFIEFNTVDFFIGVH